MKFYICFDADDNFICMGEKDICARILDVSIPIFNRLLFKRRMGDDGLKYKIYSEEEVFHVRKDT